MRPAAVLAAAAAVLALSLAAATITAAAPATSTTALADCFGHQGVQFGNKDAYVCEVKLGGDPSGGLYFMVTLDNGVNGVLGDGVNVLWYKLHPAPGNLWVFETLFPGGSPRDNGRSVQIDTSPTGYCQVLFPSWTVTPTECQDFTNGGTPGAVHVMTAQEQASVGEFIKNMQAAIPLADR